MKRNWITWWNVLLVAALVPFYAAWQWVRKLFVK